MQCYARCSASRYAILPNYMTARHIENALVILNSLVMESIPSSGHRAGASPSKNRVFFGILQSLCGDTPNEALNGPPSAAAIRASICYQV